MKRNLEREKRLAEALRDNLRKRKPPAEPVIALEKPKPNSER